jgi:hypothetical protein
MTSTRGPVVMLGALAVLLVAAGVLPWVVGGSGAARGFGVPLLVVGLFAGYAVVRGGRAPAAAAPVRTSEGCGGCRCGAGGCAAAAAQRGTDDARADAD